MKSSARGTSYRRSTGTGPNVSAEAQRLREDERRQKNWKRWGPYLSERQWGTVREDYSPWGSCWDYFPHDHARSRAYRWGEDGLLGICDRECRLCFSIALWNGRDPILKERLFGLTGPEGNHGEDVKECYFYLDSTPTHSYMKALYKYPQAEFPYTRLVEENRRRGKQEREIELADTGVFDDGRYFDVLAEYAKASPDDIAVRITVTNHGPDSARLDLLPTLWLRNSWAWGRSGDAYAAKPGMALDGDAIVAEHSSLGRFHCTASSAQVTSAAGPSAMVEPNVLFTDNETNTERLYGTPGPAHAKDAFDAYIVHGQHEAVNAENAGTKAAHHYRLDIPAGGQAVVYLRLASVPNSGRQSVADLEQTFRSRIEEADEFYASSLPSNLTADERTIMRQGNAGLLWSKQFYCYIVDDWLEGDPAQPAPPPEREHGRNHEWRHVYNRDVISMPDKWEYPWYAAWDLAFHMIPFAQLDAQFAKEQLVLFLREWYMHPNGQIPAYEFALNDVNPPVHAWSAWRVYKMTGGKDGRDRIFLSRVFQKLLLNFTWWVNRKDAHGRNLFSGGFLGLDNIGVFDRSQALPTGGHLEQADGTAWMAFYCATMLSMAMELARDNPACEDTASKFFEHFVAISDAMNSIGGHGLWDEDDGFYYDQLHANDAHVALKVRSLVGLMPLLAVEVIEEDLIERLPGFAKRMNWFLKNRPDLAQSNSYMDVSPDAAHAHRLLAIPSRDRLVRVLRYMLDENEFLSSYGIRSVSKVHAQQPYVFRTDGQEYRVSYVPGESDTGLFGGNSNWRGPIWFPINYLLIEALERYDHFYGATLRVECPTGSGQMLTLGEVANELAARLVSIFLPDANGGRPCYGGEARYADQADWRELVLFHEYFHGETGRGLGASHQTGWTALVLRCIEKLARARGGVLQRSHVA